jgi:hypothetical protein
LPKRSSGDKEETHAMRPAYPDTPDGRYFVVRGRLWRKSNPGLDEAQRVRAVAELMSARRAVRDARADPERMAQARLRVDSAKMTLGERGPVWWDDGAPDYNRHMAKNTPYAAWFEGVDRYRHLETETETVPPPKR